MDYQLTEDKNFAKFSSRRIRFTRLESLYRRGNGQTLWNFISPLQDAIRNISQELSGNLGVNDSNIVRVNVSIGGKQFFIHKVDGRIYHLGDLLRDPDEVILRNIMTQLALQSNSAEAYSFALNDEITFYCYDPPQELIPPNAAFFA